MDEEKVTQKTNEDILAEVLDENKASQTEGEAGPTQNENESKMLDDVDTEKKGSAKKPIILTIIALAAAACLTFCAVWFNPSNIVQRAISKTAVTVAQRPSVLGTIYSNSSSLADEKSLSLTLAGTINQNTISEKFNGIGGKLVSDFDRENKLASAKLSATYEGAELLNADVYTDDKIILFAMPAVMDKVLQLNCENILSQYASSELCTDKDSIDTENDITIKVFGDEGDEGQVNTQSLIKLSTLASESWNNQFSNIKSNISVTRDGSQTININGTDTPCKGYRMTISGDDIKSLILGTVKDVYGDETFKTYLKTSCSAVYNNNAMYKLFIASEDEFYNLVATRIDSVISSVDTYMDFDDLTITMFVNNGCIVNAVAASALSVGSDKVGLDFDFDLSSIEEIKTNITVTSDEGTVVYTYADKAKDNNGTIENTVELSKKDSNGTIGAEFALSLNQAGGDATVDIGILSGDEKTLTLNMVGTVISDSDGISAEFDDVSLKQYDDSLDMSLEFDLSKLENPVTPPEGEILKMFEDDPESVKVELQAAKDKIESLVKKVSSKLNNDN